MSTEQQPLTDQDPFEATIAVTDLEELAAALEPVDDRVTLEVTTSELTAAAHDLPNVYATRVTKPIDANQPTTLVVETDDLAETVETLRWQDDDTRLEVDDGDDSTLYIYNGDEHGETFGAVPLHSESDAQEPPTLENMTEACNWGARATAPAWELAGTLRKVATPAHARVDVMIEEGTFAAIGNNQPRSDDPWPFCDTFEIDVEHYPLPVSPRPFSAAYLCDVADALPMGATVTVRYGRDTPLWLATESGVEIFLAPRVVEGESDPDDREIVTDGGITQVPPTDWYCPDCGEHHRTPGDPPSSCYTCGEPTEWQRTRPTDDRELVTDGGERIDDSRSSSEVPSDVGTLRTTSCHWTPTAGTDTDSPHACRNCGARHTLQYARVFGDSETDTLWHCHDCDEPEICGRDMKQGAGSNPDYDPAVDRGQTTEHYPVFGGDAQ